MSNLLKKGVIKLQIEQLIKLPEIDLPDFTLPTDAKSTNTKANQEGIGSDDSEPSAEIIFCLAEVSMAKWRNGKELISIWWS